MQAELEKLAAAELRRAATLFGETNHSDHESYAVLKEEIEEALAEVRQIEPLLEEYWKHVKTNTAKMPPHDQTLVLRYRRGCLYTIEKYALKAAEELIQVAAMCKKAVNTMDKPKEDPDGD